MVMNTATHRWLHKLGAAFIGGGAGAGASAVSGMMIDPAKFNLSTGFWDVLGLMAGTFVVSGLVSAFFYLQKFPVPDDTEDAPKPPQYEDL